MFDKFQIKGQNFKRFVLQIFHSRGNVLKLWNLLESTLKLCSFRNLLKLKNSKLWEVSSLTLTNYVSKSLERTLRVYIYLLKHIWHFIPQSFLFYWATSIINIHVRIFHCTLHSAPVVQSIFNTGRPIIARWWIGTGVKAGF